MGLPIKSRAVNKKNRTNRLPKTICSALFALRVPKNIAKVNSPHMKKYAAIAVSVGAEMPEKKDSLGKTNSATKDHQKRP